ncbi:hypothetical protein D1013_06880 [Euzebyella marina]|uniref:DUF998 domain-containing protein n=1 Tax=Euzebyella marina TaxID=1761453 RepID=A0A3G2L4F9_9FLAO|nr:hypothetical protein [Euzebyella marina]AYN67111.1 hypothetical protein D1013_06880 [Euzebyella marina]
MEYQTRAEIRYGGILLILGALTTIMCILLEVNAGWASLIVEIKRTDYEAGKFLFKNWNEMSSIWNWALFGNVFLAIASILLIKDTKKIGWFPSSFFWSIYLIGSALLIVSFAISLGSYFNALKVIDDQPYLFETIRGTPLYLFNVGALFQLSVCIIYFQQGFSKQGIVSRGLAIIMLVILISSLVLAVLGITSVVIFAIACFLVPLSLGIFYTKLSLDRSEIGS